MNKIDGIIFDVDGTMWDAVPALWKAWKDEIAEQGYEYSFSETDIRNLCGQQMYVFGDVLFADLSVEKRRDLAHQCSNHQNDRMFENRRMTLYPEVCETLKELAKEYKLFIVTNAEDGYAQLFKRYTETEDLFDDFEHAGENRTKADNIRWIVERNHLQNAVYVGDTLMDQKSSQDAGVPFIWAEYGFGVDLDSPLLIHTFAELPKYLRELQSEEE